MDASTPTGKHSNRLCGETSPYLLQHANNPVDWHPWDEQALSLAREKDIPIFLSIGYAACHWCHVMERESFEDEVTAAFMNEHFLNIKVDREERPDLDAIYMNAVTAMTGNGGWPLNVFLTPDLRPFYGGTYFPPDGRYGTPAFLDILKQIDLLWKTSRSKLFQSAEQLTALLARHGGSPESEHDVLSAGLREAAAAYLESAYDKTWGGWGSAPKFPSPATISLLLRGCTRESNTGHLEMALSTLRKMAAGGIYDHVGGGFHRYATDERWLVPHFEKMLYDNAQLAVSYLEAWQVTHDAFFKTVTCDILNYVLRNMRDPAGAFYSSEDADSEGEEGKYYLWDKAEIMHILGPEDGQDCCAYYAVREEGNFTSHEPYHQGRNILHTSPKSDERVDSGRLAAWKEKLLNARIRRIRPGIDDKVITAWNAMMITALARAGFTWNIPEYTSAACKAGRFLREIMYDGSILYRIWRRDRKRFPGYLDDYALTANAFTDLYECTGDESWLKSAQTLTERMLDGFYDPEGKGFYSTGPGHENLIVRMKAFHDTAEPSPNAVAALVLSRLGLLFDLPRYLVLARKSLLPAAAMALRNAPGYLHTLLAADFLIDPPVEVVFCGSPDTPEIAAMIEILSGHHVPCKVIAWASDRQAPPLLPICAAKTMEEGRGTVYICRNGACLPPETTPEGLEKALKKD